MKHLILSVLVLTGALGGSALGLTPDEENTIRIYEAIRPSVVMIAVQAVQPVDQAVPEQVLLTGSGFAIQPGLLVTNYHVVKNARSISVVLHDGRRGIARIVGTAPGFDIAVLGVSFSSEELPPAPLGTLSDLQVGQKVLTVSSPLGLHHSVTVGVVSSLYRELPGLELGSSLIQFDAALNPGQSGGPLVDSSGRVVGVTTAKVAAAEGIGFAIPVGVVINILPELKAMGHVFRPKLGFTGTTIDSDLAVLFDLPGDHGVLVESIEDNGIAQGAGLRSGTRRVFLAGREYVLGGDILTEMNGVPIRGTGDLVLRLLATRPGDKVSFTVVDGRSRRVIQLSIPGMKH